METKFKIILPQSTAKSNPLAVGSPFGESVPFEVKPSSKFKVILPPSKNITAEEYLRHLPEVVSNAAGPALENLLWNIFPNVKETIVDVSSRMKAGKNIFQAYKENWEMGDEEDRKKEEDVKRQVKEAKEKGASDWELSVISSKSPMFQRSVDMAMGFSGGMKMLGPEDIITPVQRVTQALKEAKPLRKVQETIYSKLRSSRLGKALEVGKEVAGEKGFYAELGELKGEFPKVQFESIRNKISQSDIDELFVAVKNNPLLSDWEKIAARGGLAKLFGEYGGGVPTQGELSLLERVFPKDFVKTVLGKRPFLEKAKELGLQLANVPRSLRSSFDLSAPFRQGIFFVTRPKQFVPAFSKMFGAFGSEKYFQEIQESIVSKPSYKLMKESGLALSEMGTSMAQREEAFMSNLAEKIPIIGKGVRASGRAYTGFLNKLRADVFDDLIKKADKAGLDPTKNLDLTKEIANFVNVGTGRGGLGKLEAAATALNSFFFSPRLMSSRLTLMNPMYYIKADPFVRKEALKSLFGFTGAALTVMGLAKLSGAEVGTDWRSADFGKVKIGKTRLDFLGGFQQYIRATGQLVTGEYVSSVTGKKTVLGEGYKPLTRLDILLRQVESKEAPIFSFITDLLRGKDYLGQPLGVKSMTANLFVPMIIQDIADLYKTDPDLLPLGLLGIFGVGVQSYVPFKKKESSFKMILP